MVAINAAQIDVNALFAREVAPDSQVAHGMLLLAEVLVVFESVRAGQVVAASW